MVQVLVESHSSRRAVLNFTKSNEDVTIALTFPYPNALGADMYDAD